jgi:hypothetical protein
MKTSLRIVLLLTLLVAIPAGCLWATPIRISGGSAFSVVANGIDELNLRGTRGFSLNVFQDVGTFTDVFAIPINYQPSTYYSTFFDCCRNPDLPWTPAFPPGRATLRGKSYFVSNEGTANLAVVSLTTPTVSLPRFDYNCVGYPCGASIALPASLSGTFRPTDAGQSTTETLVGRGIARLGFEQGRAIDGLSFGFPEPGLDALAWQRPVITYTFGVSPDLADFVWRDAEGNPLQGSPEPATLLLVGSTGAAGPGVARWLKRRRAQ